MPNESRCIWKEVSDRGLRDDNQDRAISISPDEGELIKKKGVLMVACDGAGNELAGRRAAELAADVCLDSYYTDDAIDPTRALQSAVARANQAVLDEARIKRLDGMATTIIAAVVFKNKLYIAHVGDSRAYLVRDGRMTRLTQDHTSLAEKINEGSLTSEETRKISKRRAITRMLGTPKATPDINTRELRWGDRVLLCTDGLYDAIDETRMEQTLGRYANPERACNILIKTAVANSSNDNITASVLNYGEVKAVASLGPWAIGAGVLALVAALAFLVYTILSGRDATPVSDGLPTSLPIATAAPATARPRPSATNAAAGAAVGAPANTAVPGVQPQAPTPTTIPTKAAIEPTQTSGPEATPTLAIPATQPPPATERARPTSVPTIAGGTPGVVQPTATDPPANFEVVVPVPGVSVFTNPRYDLGIVSTGFERWGRPTSGGGCEQYYDVTPVYQFKLTLRIKNNTSTPLRNWSAQYQSGGSVITTCHDGGGTLPTVAPGEERVVRLLAYLNTNQQISALIIKGDQNTERTCFVDNKVARCP